MAISIVDYQETTSAFAAGTASRSTPSMTWLAGDLFVAIGGTEDLARTLGTPTNAGLTFAAIGSALASGSNCWGHKWQATAASSGSGAIAQSAAGAGDWGMGVLQLRDHGGVGTTAAIQSSALTISLANAGSNSVVFFFGFDWNGSTAPRTFTPGSSTARENTQDGAKYSIFGASWTGQSGTVSYGLTTGTVAFTKIAVEILDATATDPVPNFSHRVLRAVQRSASW